VSSSWVPSILCSHLQLSIELFSLNDQNFQKVFVLLLKFINVFADSDDQSDTTAFPAAMDISHFRQLIREAEQEYSIARDPPRMKEVAKSIASNMKLHGVHASVLHCCMIAVTFRVSCR